MITALRLCRCSIIFIKWIAWLWATTERYQLAHHPSEVFWLVKLFLLKGRCPFLMIAALRAFKYNPLYFFQMNCLILRSIETVSIRCSPFQGLGILFIYTFFSKGRCPFLMMTALWALIIHFRTWISPNGALSISPWPRHELIIREIQKSPKGA